MSIAEQFPPPVKFIRAHLFKILFQELKTCPDLRERVGQAETHNDLLDLVLEVKERISSSSKLVEYKVENSWYRRHRKQAHLTDKAPVMEKCLDSGFSLLHLE
jgi:tRNA-dihydrouridine synthase 1